MPKLNKSDLEYHAHVLERYNKILADAQLSAESVLNEWIAYVCKKYDVSLPFNISKDGDITATQPVQLGVEDIKE